MAPRWPCGGAPRTVGRWGYEWMGSARRHGADWKGHRRDSRCRGRAPAVHASMALTLGCTWGRGGICVFPTGPCCLIRIFRGLQQ